MMYNRWFAMSLVVVLSGCVSNVAGFGFRVDAPYGHPTVNRMHNRVQQYLAISTSEVAQRADTETDVAKTFKKEMLSDPTDGEEISEERKNRKCMQQIKIALRKEEASGEKLELTEFKENESIAFDNKEKALIAQRDGLFAKKVMYASLAVSGVGLMCLGVKVHERPKDAGTIMFLNGAIITLADLMGLCSTMGQEAKLNTHIDQTKTMKKGWEKV